MRTTNFIPTIFSFTGDTDTVRHENEACKKWGWDHLVESVEGKLQEVESHIIIKFKNGDELTEHYTFKPHGENPEHIYGIINGRPHDELTDDYSNDYLSNDGSFSKALVHFYIDTALKLRK